MSPNTMKESFDQHFQHWQIELPLTDFLHRRRGSINEQGWTINYRFGKEAEREFLEYFASHRMTNDTLNRIWEDGVFEPRGACQEFYASNDESARQAFIEHNREFYRQVEEAGLK